MKASEQAVKDLIETVRGFYGANGRSMPWRVPEPGGGFDPYKILVSEMMLQQTQVGRVIPKYEAFMQQYPGVEMLAQAQLAQVLVAWSGLGYNRRAKYLWQAARHITDEWTGEVPNDASRLQELLGIGPNTAAAIVTYAFDEPEPFIETNIRTVFIHHFHVDTQPVADADILYLLKRAMAELDHTKAMSYRHFFWGLMDYGTQLKQAVGNLNTRSTHYTKQSVFEGSRRQLRGNIIKQLMLRPTDITELHALIADTRLEAVLKELVAEKLIQKSAQKYHL